jgi:hypothetical protein
MFTTWTVSTLPSSRLASPPRLVRSLPLFFPYPRSLPPPLTAPEPVSPTLPYEELPLTGDDDATPASTTAAAVASGPSFDDAEDSKLIQESKNRQFKKKGLNPRADRSKAGKGKKEEKE